MKRRLLALAAVMIPLSGCDALTTASVATRYVAKMTCSCVYVVERDLQACTADLPESTGQVSLENDADNKQVSASVLFLVKAKAQYTEGEGCKLVG